MARLVEILALEMEEWPEGVTHLTQSEVDREIYDGLDGKTSDSVRSLNPRFDALKSHSEKSYPMVTQEQWQAERDKQKGGEWKRHRGGKQPVADDVVIEYKTRSGYTDTWSAKSLSWSHEGGEGDLMQYRVISQPQAEEVEVTKPELTYKLDWVEVDDTKPVANPLAWRDTIIHCQAIIEDCEREIERNVALLDSEGLLMQLEPKKGMQAYDVPAVDMGDWRNWQTGDIVECVSAPSKHDGYYTEGQDYRIKRIDLDDEGTSTEIDVVCDSSFSLWCPASSFAFVRRP